MLARRPGSHVHATIGALRCSAVLCGDFLLVSQFAQHYTVPRSFRIAEQVNLPNHEIPVLIFVYQDSMKKTFVLV